MKGSQGYPIRSLSKTVGVSVVVVGAYLMAYASLRRRCPELVSYTGLGTKAIITRSEQ